MTEREREMERKRKMDKLEEKKKKKRKKEKRRIGQKERRIGKQGFIAEIKFQKHFLDLKARITLVGNHD